VSPVDRAEAAEWQPVCGLSGCEQQGPCAARRQALRLVPAILKEEQRAGHTPQPDRWQDGGFRIASNIWLLTAEVCELPAGERRDMAATLLGEHWPESCGLDAAGRARAMAELLELADAILSRPRRA
jgi:hypothetical protein